AFTQPEFVSTNIIRQRFCNLICSFPRMRQSHQQCEQQSAQAQSAHQHNVHWRILDTRQPVDGFEAQAPDLAMKIQPDELPKTGWHDGVTFDHTVEYQVTLRYFHTIKYIQID